MKFRSLAFLLSLIMLACLLPCGAIAASVAAPVLSADAASYEEGALITLSWTAVAKADDYELFVSKYPYGEENLVWDELTADTECHLFGLSAGRYRANVKAFASGSSSSASRVIYFTVGNAQAASTSDSGVTFLWPVKDDPSYSGSGYCITAMDIYFDGGPHGSRQNALDINHDGLNTRYETREIVATADGEVIDIYSCRHGGMYCSTRNCEGTYIKIQHELPDPNTGELTTYISFYTHLDPKTVAVEEGDYVTQGQTLAKMGSSGNSSGVHLHFAIRNENNKDIPTLEFFMNDTYMPLICFKYFKKNSAGLFVAQDGAQSRYSQWITEHYVYQDGLWVYND